MGGVQKEITLIVRFEPKDSAAVLSQPTRQLLPGRTPPEQIRGGPGDPAVSSYAAAGLGGPGPSGRQLGSAAGRV